MRHALVVAGLAIVLSATALPAQSDPQAIGEAGEVFGIASSGFSTLLGNHLHGSTVNDNLVWKGWNSGDSLSCSSTSEGIVATGAFLDIPAGARLEHFGWWAKDVHLDEDLQVELRERCQEPNDGTPTDSGIGFDGTTGSSGNQQGSFSLASATIDADTRNCVYYVKVQFCTSAACNCTGNAISFYKARLQWRRQVSPAPQSASYSDVPTNHTYFQYIEALKSSGITAGCGGGKFCPDDPVTRAQLAGFLAKALGLHWPFNPQIIFP